MQHLDILVCGNCYSAYYSIETFRAHKMTPCTPVKPTVKDNLENSPVILSFLSFEKSLSPLPADQSVWDRYQEWIKLPPAVKKSWLIAARKLLMTKTLKTRNPRKFKLNNIQHQGSNHDGNNDNESVHTVDHNTQSVIFNSDAESDSGLGDSALGFSEQVDSGLDDSTTSHNNFQDANENCDKVESQRFIQKVIEKRLNGENNKTEYFVEWVGGGNNSWVSFDKFKSLRDVLKIDIFNKLNAKSNNDESKNKPESSNIPTLNPTNSSQLKRKSTSPSLPVQAQVRSTFPSFNIFFFYCTIAHN